MKKLEGTFVKVTTTELYLFQPRYTNNWSIEEVIQSWFRDYPIDTSHAARDGARIGYSKRLVSTEIITEKEASEYARGK